MVVLCNNVYLLSPESSNCHDNSHVSDEPSYIRYCFFCRYPESRFKMGKPYHLISSLFPIPIKSTCFIRPWLKSLGCQNSKLSNTRQVSILSFFVLYHRNSKMQHTIETFFESQTAILGKKSVRWVLPNIGYDIQICDYRFRIHPHGTK